VYTDREVYNIRRGMKNIPENIVLVDIYIYIHATGSENIIIIMRIHHGRLIATADIIGETLMNRLVYGSLSIFFPRPFSVTGPSRV